MRININFGMYFVCHEKPPTLQMDGLGDLRIGSANPHFELYLQILIFWYIYIYKFISTKRLSVTIKLGDTELLALPKKVQISWGVYQHFHPQIAVYQGNIKKWGFVDAIKNED